MVLQHRGSSGPPTNSPSGDFWGDPLGLAAEGAGKESHPWRPYKQQQSLCRVLVNMSFLGYGVTDYNEIRRIESIKMLVPLNK
jgi:hypothetical protein